MNSIKLNNLLRQSTIVIQQPSRCAGIKKKYNFADQPAKIRPSIRVKTLRGFQFNDGDFVYKGDILVRQYGSVTTSWEGKLMEYMKSNGLCSLRAQTNKKGLLEGPHSESSAEKFIREAVKRREEQLTGREMGLEIYPGEFVNLDRETWDLVALCNGRFTISTEKLSPYPDSPLYKHVQLGHCLTKPFVHVISDPIEPVHRLKRLL